MLAIWAVSALTSLIPALTVEIRNLKRSEISYRIARCISLTQSRAAENIGIETLAHGLRRKTKCVRALTYVIGVTVMGTLD